MGKNKISSPLKVMASMRKHFPAFIISLMPYGSQSDSIKELTCAKKELFTLFVLILGNVWYSVSTSMI